MKTKAYKLAAELGVQEASLLDWLRAHGYPNVRRADMIRAEVVRAATRALGRSGGASVVQRDRRPKPDGRPMPHSVSRDRADPDESLTASFAELLEAHLPSDSMAGSVPDPDLAGTLPSMPAIRFDDEPTIDFGEFAEELTRERDDARREADEWRIRYERARSDLRDRDAELGRLAGESTEVHGLRSERERILLEQSRLRQRLASVEDERATVEQTAGELQAELSEVREALLGYQREASERDGVVGELASAKQRESAWRTRALELERVAHMGESLAVVLQRLGLESPDDQAGGLAAILGVPHGAIAMLRAIRQVDVDAVAKLVGDRLSKVCAHPICNHVAALDNQFALRVDNDANCVVCRGSGDRRWFARMVRECARAGVRRLLVVGGSASVHQSLRDLSQGQPVDLRLLPNEEVADAERVLSRVEACDIVVCWSASVVSGDISARFREHARERNKPVASVSGVRGRVSDLARAVSGRLARDLALATG